MAKQGFTDIVPREIPETKEAVEQAQPRNNGLYETGQSKACPYFPS